MWYLTGRDERLASRPVRSRGFVTLCPLMPGEYDYRVERLPRAESGGAGQRGLAGRIVVLGSPDPPPVGAVP